MGGATPCGDPEAGQQSTSDASTIVQPGAAWAGDQPLACPHGAHYPRHKQ